MHLRPIVRALSVATFVLAGSAPATTASAGTTPGTSVTVASVEANLSGPDLTRWKSLTNGQRAVTVRILSDPAFGVPSAAATLPGRYRDLKVEDSASPAIAPVTALTSVSRTSWVRQNWTIFGITYTEITTTMGYSTSGSVVTGVNRCYGTYVNYVPLRSINSNSWSTLGNGLADCWTEWTLARPLQSTVTGIQGLRVNGYGQILKVWRV